MVDPFQDVDSVSPELLKIVVSALESRAVEADMVPIVDRYLDQISWTPGSTHVEIGAGTGPIARMMALRAKDGLVIGIDPSDGLIVEAKKLAQDIENLQFEVGDGASLRFDDSSLDSVVMHTVLSHVPEPSQLLNEAYRILKPGGRLVVCDADFEKSAIGNFVGDPLNSCAEFFVRNYVTHPYLISNIRRLAAEANFEIDEFRVDSRVIAHGDGGLGWIRMSANQMVAQGAIGEELAAALANEYRRRKDASSLYGHQPFGTLIAARPS